MQCSSKYNLGTDKNNMSCTLLMCNLELCQCRQPNMFSCIIKYMSALSALKIYLLATTLFFAIDMVWLGFVAQKFYSNQIGFLMKSDINWIAAITFYLLFIAGLCVFVILPSIEKNSFIQALLLGGFFGLVTYATYDLTNLATLKDWPLTMTIVDMIWGTTLGASVSGLTYYIATKWNIFS